MARDNFSTKVIEKIRGRVANRCSNPQCRVPTTGPSEDDPEKVNIIGIAAHIYAASAGGPRYDANMTSRERRSIDNGIWLCSNCSIDIDKDQALYTPAVLKQWKIEAEKLAREEMGNKLPGKNDATNMLASALTGLPTTFIPQAINNTIKATTSVLENLDPRFSVTTSYKDNVTTFLMSAKEDVTATFTVNPENAQDFSFKLERLFDHGEVLELDSTSIAFKGSKLLEEITSRHEKGVVKFLPKSRKEAVVRLVLIGPDGSDVHLVEVKGILAAGRKTISFTGSTYDGIFSINLQSNIELFLSKDLNIDFTVDFDRFLDISLTQLPHFEEIHNFYERLNANQKLTVILEIEGKPLFKATLNDIKNHSNFQYICNCLDFINISRNILNLLRVDVTFQNGYVIQAKVFDLLNKVNSAMTGNNIFPAEKFGSGTTSVIVIKDVAAALSLNLDGPREMSFEQTEPYIVNLFGKEVSLPKIAIKFDKAVPHMNIDANDIKEGQEVEVGWVFEPDCKCSIVLI